MPCKLFTRLSLIAVLVVPLHSAIAAPNNDITRSSVSAAGLQGNGVSASPAVDGSGYFVAFSSAANNLTFSDSYNKKNIYIKNRTTNAVTKVTAGNSDSLYPNISKDSAGQFTVFQSAATNLVNTIVNGTTVHVYKYNSTSGVLSLISQTGSGTPGNGNSTAAVVNSTGQYVAFQSNSNNFLSPTETKTFSDIYLFNSANSGTPITRVSNTPGIQEPNGASTAPSISNDGRYIAFQSAATDLVGTADTNGKSDVYLSDQNSGTIKLLSNIYASTATSNGDSITPAVSGNGSVVAFVSNATNIVANGTSTVAKNAIYLYTLATGTTIIIDRNFGGVKCNGNSTSPSVSGNGQYVAFVSDCSDLVNADTNNAPDLFVYDTVSNKIIGRKNLTTGLLQTYGGVGLSSINTNGSVVVFESPSTTLVPADTNAVADIFATDTNCPTDSDADGTKDCTDGCPFDPAKTSPGVCGCGSPDVDTDGDGSLDCADACPSDPANITPETCICGSADPDNNGNGVPDCLDPNSSTVPGRAVITYNNGKNGKRTIYVQIPTEFTNVNYKVELLRGKVVVARLACDQRHSAYSNLNPGKYTARYKAGVAGTFSKYSTTRTIPVRRGRGANVVVQASCY